MAKMKPAKFWSLVDQVLVSISEETEIYTFGPKKIGRACCNTCSVAEMLVDVEPGSEVSWLYYHDQEFERGKSEVNLGWNGWDAYEEFSKRAQALGLVVEKPAGDHLKIVVQAPVEN